MMVKIYQKCCSPQLNIILPTEWLKLFETKKLNIYSMVLELNANVQSNSSNASNHDISYNDTTLYSKYATNVGNNKYLQRKCYSTQLIYELYWVKWVYIILAIICIPIGIIICVISNSIVYEETIPYNTINACKINGDWGKFCSIQHEFQRNMKSPIYLHYKITNMYQNYKEYVHSRSPKQYRNITPLYVKYCNNAKEYSGLKILPCGVIANSFFNGILYLFILFLKKNILYLLLNIKIKLKVC